jgi:hypothetical protein
MANLKWLTDKYSSDLFLIDTLSNRLIASIGSKQSVVPDGFSQFYVTAYSHCDNADSVLPRFVMYDNVCPRQHSSLSGFYDKLNKAFASALKALNAAAMPDIPETFFGPNVILRDVKDRNTSLKYREAWVSFDQLPESEKPLFNETAELIKTTATKYFGYDEFNQAVDRVKASDASLSVNDFLSRFIRSLMGAILARCRDNKNVKPEMPNLLLIRNRDFRTMTRKLTSITGDEEYAEELKTRGFIGMRLVPQDIGWFSDNFKFRYEWR